MNEILPILIANAIILVIPGVNFSVIVRNALLFGSTAAQWTALGITAAIMIHVLFGIFSLSVIFYTYPMLFEIIKYLGCVYLLYLGIRFIASSFKTYSLNLENSSIVSRNEDFHNFKTGFMIDILNPFVSIFYVSVFTPVIAKDISRSAITLCVICIALLTFGWFLSVGKLFSREKIRGLLLKYQSWIQRISGLTMFYFAYQLFISQL